MVYLLCYQNLFIVRLVCQNKHTLMSALNDSVNASISGLNATASAGKSPVNPHSRIALTYRGHTPFLAGNSEGLFLVVCRDH